MTKENLEFDLKTRKEELEWLIQSCQRELNNASLTLQDSGTVNQYGILQGTASSLDRVAGEYMTIKRMLSTYKK